MSIFLENSAFVLCNVLNRLWFNLQTFKLTSVNGVRYSSSFISLHVTIQFSQHHLLRRLTLLHFLNLHQNLSSKLSSEPGIYLKHSQIWANPPPKVCNNFNKNTSYTISYPNFRESNHLVTEHHKLLEVLLSQHDVSINTIGEPYTNSSTRNCNKNIKYKFWEL